MFYTIGRVLIDLVVMFLIKKLFIMDLVNFNL